MIKISISSTNAITWHAISFSLDLYGYYCFMLRRINDNYNWWLYILYEVSHLKTTSKNSWIILLYARQVLVIFVCNPWALRRSAEILNVLFSVSYFGTQILGILCKISPRLIPQDATDDKSALVEWDNLCQISLKFF